MASASSNAFEIYFDDVGGAAADGSSSAGGSPAKKGRGGGGGQVVSRCQVEGCNVDLSDAKSYYSRHKVCGKHSKSPKVVVSGIHQRFCQQCSRSALRTLFSTFLCIIHSCNLFFIWCYCVVYCLLFVNVNVNVNAICFVEYLFLLFWGETFNLRNIKFVLVKLLVQYRLV